MNRRAFVVVDLGFGDAGKGSIVDYLVRRHDAGLVVRFNGGPQAGHNVVLPDGRHHTFAQFGSGSFVPGVRTLLSKFMLLDPYAMLNEAGHLRAVGVDDVLRRTIIDGRCRVITPPQQVANRVREIGRGAAAHGTCGMGIGECVGDDLADPAATLRAGELADRSVVRRKMAASMERKSAELGDLLRLAAAEDRRVFDDLSWIDTATDVCGEIARQVRVVDPVEVQHILMQPTVSIFEGAQGVLLDERFGFHPHTTWSRTTFENADELLTDLDTERVRLGVIRPYMVRHGNGPLVTERSIGGLTEPHNRSDGRQGKFRHGILDLAVLKYALNACGGVDGMALTCADQLPLLPPIACTGYDVGGRDWTTVPPKEMAEVLRRAKPRYGAWPTADVGEYRSAVADALDVTVRIVSKGPTYQDKDA